MNTILPVASDATSNQVPTKAGEVHITKRQMEEGGTLGVDGLRHALERAENPTAASTAMAIQQAVTDCCREPLQDDGTVVVMAIE